MNRHAALIALAALGPTNPAVAQASTNDSGVAMTLTWREADLDGNPIPNPNGVLEPGEHALIVIDSVSFANQGGIAHFSPAIGTFTSGTVLGLGPCIVDINGSGGSTVGQFNINNPLANASGTSGFGVRPSWRLSGNGAVNGASNGIEILQFGQYVATPAQVDTESPVTNVFRMLWTPSDFTSRTIRFQIAGSIVEGPPCSIMVGLDATHATSVYVASTHVSLGAASIRIAPAPPTLLALSAAFFFRRSRRARGGP
jgi:hypothetical protein